MRNFVSFKKVVLVISASILLFISIHALLQHRSVITKNLKNYENVNNEVKKIKKPYDKITNENLIHWDAYHYRYLSKHGYDNSRLYMYAFFPLFPFLWKATMLPPIGIIVLNYLMFALSVFYLWFFLSKTKNYLILLFLINLPFITPFIIPYTESLFFLSITLAIIGYLKGNYWLYFAGAIFAAMTRSAITIILLSLIATEMLIYLKTRDAKTSLKRFVYSIIPLLIGTFTVLLYQKFSGAESLFTYVDAIKTWDRKLSISSGLRDWSHEGFGLNIATIFLVVPISVYIVAERVLLIFKCDQKMYLLDKNNNSKEQYILLISAVYTIGMFLTNMLFQGGSINGLFRYVLCTPFFFFQMIYMINKVNTISFSLKFYYFVFAVFAGVFTMSMSEYSASWGFSDLGFILLMISSGILLFQKTYKLRPIKIFFWVVLLLNIFWNTYMFNVFTCNGWIFT